MVYDLAIDPTQSGTLVILKGQLHESGVVCELATNPPHSGTWVILKGSPHESGVVYDLAIDPTQSGMGHIKRVSSMRAVWCMTWPLTQPSQVHGSYIKGQLHESGVVYDLDINPTQLGT